MDSPIDALEQMPLDADASGLPPAAMRHAFRSTGDGFGTIVPPLLRVLTEDGNELKADVILAGLGIEPRIELAAGAGLPIEDGIVVNEHARVAGREDVFAAGDVARFHAAALDKRTRVEHEDHAKSHGRLAGINMAGADEPYEHMPFFYSDLFDLGYEAVGELDPGLETIAELEDPSGEGVVYYLDADRCPRGVLFSDIFGRVDEGRELISARKPIAASTFSEPAR